MDPEIYSDPLEFNPERWDVSIHRCLFKCVYIFIIYYK